MAIDGSKFQAAASRKAVPSMATLERQVAQYLAALESADLAEAQATVVQPPPAAIQAALAKLEALRTIGSGRALTEPEARLMHGQTGPAYNVQTAVDARHGVIVAHEVTEEATDTRSLQPMAEAAKKALEVTSLNVVADAGYSSGMQVEALEAQQVLAHLPVNRSINNQGDGRLFDRSAFEYEAARDVYRCPAGQPLRRKQLQRSNRAVLYAAVAASCAACRLKSRCTSSTRRYVSRHQNEDALRRLAARTTAQHMQLRRETVERPFAELKWRIFGHPRFLMRGRHGAGSAMAIGVLVYNLKQALRILGTVGLHVKLAST